MPVEVVWSRRAREALLEIYVAVARENPAAAERIYDRIGDRARQLAMYPRLGPRRPEIRASVRILVEAPFLILYATVPDSEDQLVERVEIVNIVHGRRNIAWLLDQET